jgi:hypothetical protein
LAKLSIVRRARSKEVGQEDRLPGTAKGTPQDAVKDTSRTEIVERLRMNRGQDDQDTPMDREEEHLKDKVICQGMQGATWFKD